MNPCENLEPHVIDHHMIERFLEEQGLKGEAGRLAKNEGIPWDEVTEIRLEYMAILRIDHLWVLPALTKLSLSNNLIEVIVNLESLVNLKELDLSFNKIEKIENLETLVHLEVLCLYDNLINHIENIEKLRKLTIFTIGKNQITDMDNALSLRQFRNLKSLNMRGNPCAESDDFRLFIAAFLPILVYYEYKVIEDTERELGMLMYEKKLRDLVEYERTFLDKQRREEEEAREAELHAESFVEFLNTSHLFDLMYENDVDGKVYLHMGDEVMDLYNEYLMQFLEVCLQIFTMGQEEYHNRHKEVESFNGIVGGAKQKSQQESIACMDDFIDEKEKMISDVRKLQDDIENRELTKDMYKLRVYEYRVILNEMIHQVWKKLMGLELTIFEQIEEANQTFEHTLTEMVSYFIEQAQGHFAQIRTLETTYQENITEQANRFFTLSLITDDFIVPKILEPYRDKEVLTNGLITSHDLHMQVIDNREDRLITRAKAWLNNLVDNLQRNEIVRDRAKILEINHFLDIQREEFEEACKYQTTDHNPDDV